MWDGKLIMTSAIAAAMLFGLGSQMFPTVEAQAAPTQITNDLAPAKDLATFREDLALTNNCIETGRNKSECLCVTRVLKYELSLRDYRLASQLFAHSASAPDQPKFIQALSDQGYADADVTRISRVTTALTQAKDFQNRCSMADSYFKAQAQ